jgi:hypothetical protein
MKAGMISHFATFKIELYKKSNGINQKLKRAVDQDLYLKLEEVGSMMFVDIPLYYYRVHDGGISTLTNYNKAYTWNLYVRINACERRGLNIEEILTPILNSEVNIRNYYENSLNYKLGIYILMPFRYIHKILKKKI